MPRDIVPHLYYGEALNTRRAGIATKQNVVETLRLTMRDPSGNPLDINALETELGKTLEPKVAFREATLAELSLVEDTAAFDDKAAGLITFTLPSDIRQNAAIYIGEAALSEVGSNSEDVYAVTSFYVYVEPSHWSSNNSTLLYLDDVRLSLRDSSYLENELLGNHEFDIAELSYAIARTVQYWNELPPAVMMFTTKTFPFRNLWMTGTQLFLFELLEEHYRRNQFPYSAGGMSIDDKNKHTLYRAAWQDRFGRFTAELKHQKYRINAGDGIVSVGGAYIFYGN